MQKYTITPRPEYKGLRTVYADSLEDAVQEGYALWEEYGKPRPMRMGAICMETGETLDHAECAITGNVQVVRGKVSRKRKEKFWKEISVDEGKDFKHFTILPTPDNPDDVTEILAASLEEALDACLSLWEGRELPEYASAVDVDEMESFDLQRRSSEKGGGRRFYGKFIVKGDDVRWEPDRKKNKKHGYDSPTDEELLAEAGQQILLS